jgi:hypothetical protein
MIFASAVVTDAEQRPASGVISQPEDSYRILVKKAERKLLVYRTTNGKERLAKSYAIALGNTPTGHKTRQGDGRMPEGDYYITHKNPKSNYYLSLGVSYPNIQDAEAGLKNGIITKAQYEAITAAIRAQASRRRTHVWAATSSFTTAT